MWIRSPPTPLTTTLVGFDSRVALGYQIFVAYVRAHPEDSGGGETGVVGRPQFTVDPAAVCPPGLLTVLNTAAPATGAVAKLVVGSNANLVHFRTLSRKLRALNSSDFLHVRCRVFQASLARVDSVMRILQDKFLI